VAQLPFPVTCDRGRRRWSLIGSYDIVVDTDECQHWLYLTYIYAHTQQPFRCPSNLSVSAVDYHFRYGKNKFRHV
jgi:hypothetical protein